MAPIDSQTICVYVASLAPHLCITVKIHLSANRLSGGLPRFTVYFLVHIACRINLLERMFCQLSKCPTIFPLSTAPLLIRSCAVYLRNVKCLGLHFVLDGHIDQLPFSFAFPFSFPFPLRSHFHNHSHYINICEHAYGWFSMQALREKKCALS